MSYGGLFQNNSFTSRLADLLTKDCKTLLTGAELKKFQILIGERREMFGMSPGVMAIILLVFLTLLFAYISWRIMSNKTYTDDNEKELSYTELFTIYSATVLPLVLIFYAFNIYKFGSKGFHLHYPEETWWGGKFWGAAVFTILVLSLLGIVRMQELKNSAISSVWTTISFLFVVIISAIVGLLASVLIQCKMTASADYKHKFNCAYQQIKAANQLVIDDARKKRAEAMKSIRDATRIIDEGSRFQTVEEQAASQSRKDTSVGQEAGSLHDKQDEYVSRSRNPSTTSTYVPTYTTPSYTTPSSVSNSGVNLSRINPNPSRNDPELAAIMNIVG